MSVLTDGRKDRIRAMICEHLEIPPDELTNFGLFVQDYGADSLGLIDLLSALENESGLVIDATQLERLVNVDGVHEVMAELAG